MKFVKNAHFGEYITAMCFSVHLNFIATAGAGVIFIWQYEHMRVMGACTDNLNEVNYMTFIDPYPLLVTLDKSNCICFWKISEANVFEFYSPIHKIELDGIDKYVLMQKFCFQENDLEDVLALPYAK